MKSIKTVVAELTEEEYNKAIEFKSVQIGKMTWKDMIMGFIEFKEAMAEVEAESKEDDYICVSSDYENDIQVSSKDTSELERLNKFHNRLKNRN